MFLKFILSLLFLISSIACIAQIKTPNTTDDKNNKQGLWSAVYTNGITRYTGQFKDDKPIGIFKHYDVHGNLTTEVKNNGDTADVVFYHLNKVILAKGKYYKQERIGNWKFYDSDGDISVQKIYLNNKENGPSEVYYKDGRITRKCFYRNGVKHGEIIDFFPTGKTKFKATYVDGNPDGIVKHYHPSGSIKIKGNYKNAVQDSTWVYFDYNGKIMRYEIYKNGFLKKSYTQEEAKALNQTKHQTDTTKSTAPNQIPKQD